MAATDEMLAIALRRGRMRPVSCRSGAPSAPPRAGSTSAASTTQLAPVVANSAAGIRVSLFIAAEPPQIEAAAELGAPVVEIHTGAWCDALTDGNESPAEGRMAAHSRRRRARRGVSALKFMPATASTTPAPRRSRRCREIVELNIGHFLIGEAVFDGLAETVKSCAPRWIAAAPRRERGA